MESESLALVPRVVADGLVTSPPHSPASCVSTLEGSISSTFNDQGSTSDSENQPCTNLVVKIEDINGDLADDSVVGRSSNLEIRRLRMDIIRSSFETIPHSKCHDIITKLRRRVIKLNLLLDRKKAQVSELTNRGAYLDNGVSLGLIKLMEKLQEEKAQLQSSLDTKSIELSRCIAHGEILQDKLDKFIAQEEQVVDQIAQSSKGDDGISIDDLQTKILALEKQTEELQTHHKDDMGVMTLRMENLSAKVAQLEAENEILRKENEASRSSSNNGNGRLTPGPYSPNSYRNRNSHSSFRKYPSNNNIVTPSFNSNSSNDGAKCSSASNFNDSHDRAPGSTSGNDNSNNCNNYRSHNNSSNNSHGMRGMHDYRSNNKNNRNNTKY